MGERASMLLAEADEIVHGRVRLFGGEPSPLQLKVSGAPEHWTTYEHGIGDGGNDIKNIWEPGRFGWAYTLGRAFYFNGDERYASAFWERLEEFLEANPPNLGPQWVSAQEVALRLIALAFSAQLFARSPSSTPERMERLVVAIAAHAARIPPTLAYARAQNNNHLLSEAAGLYTAGLALPGQPEASHWREIGWRWLNCGFQAQIAPDGTYIQHSTNYHRLALQIAIWCHRLARSTGETFPADTQVRLAAATRWLLALVDLETGRVPNLGPNDGAFFQPLSTCPFDDFRPVVQAAARAFLGKPAFPPGPWDEMSLWLPWDQDQGERGVGGRVDSPTPLSPVLPDLDPPHVLHCPGHPSWAYFRIAQFTSRPGHADQLHLDLWWRGLNVAQDAGTFQYNAPPPWENALAGTAVHNTVMLNGRDQMQRAGRFLWLDWAQGKVAAGERAPDVAWVRFVARHDGYRRLGITHEREVTAYPEGRWVVVDRLMWVASMRSQTSSPGLQLKPATWRLQPATARLHWLLPDWEWRLEAEGEQVIVFLESPDGPVSLRVGFGKQPEGRSPGPRARFRSDAHKWLSYAPESGPEGLPGARRRSYGPHGSSAGARRYRYKLETRREAHPELKVQVVRAGEMLYGEGQAAPTWGWVSPTYGVKIPALSISFTVTSLLPIYLASEWIFPPGEGSYRKQPGEDNPAAGV